MMLDVLDNSNPNANINSKYVIWNSLLRGSVIGSSRQECPNCFYPVWINEATQKIEYVGNPLPLSQNRSEVESNPPYPGLKAVFPIRTDGSEGRWRLGCETLKDYLKKRFAKLGTYNKKRDQWSILYLLKSTQEMLKDGTLQSKGRDSNGALMLELAPNSIRDQIPKTMWVRDWHDASTYGTNLLKKIILSNTFTYPKSLYAVHDCIQFFVANKPNALIMDFFAGSGTTLHAVNLLNAEDGGKRQCILVTNNEVSKQDAEKLSSLGYVPGDEEYEKHGIARSVTWKRTVCSIKGVDVKGNPLMENYLGSNLLMADGFKANTIYFKLGFLNEDVPCSISELLPILWLKAGAVGKYPELKETIIPHFLILPENQFAVLIDETQYSEFTKLLEMFSKIKQVFVITDSELIYQKLATEFSNKEVWQLKRNYFKNFEINV